MKVEHRTKAATKQECTMGTGKKNFVAEANMRAIMIKANITGRVRTLILMETIIRANGTWAEKMDTVQRPFPTAPNMSVNTKMVNIMGKE